MRFSWLNNKSISVTDPTAVDFRVGRKWKEAGWGQRWFLFPTSHRFHVWSSTFSPSQGRNPFFLEPSVIITVTDGNKLTHSSGVSDEVRAAEQLRQWDGAEVRAESRLNDFVGSQRAACGKMKEEQEVIASFSDANDISVDVALAWLAKNKVQQYMCRWPLIGSEGRETAVALWLAVSDSLNTSKKKPSACC